MRLSYDINHIAITNIYQYMDTTSLREWAHLNGYNLANMACAWPRDIVKKLADILTNSPTFKFSQILSMNVRSFLPANFHLFTYIINEYA